MKEKKNRVPENVQGNFLKGTLEMIVMILLSKYPMTPSQAKKEIEYDGAFYLSNINVMYNIFNRLEADGFITHVTAVHAGNRYCLTPEGVAHLDFLEHEYYKIHKKIESIKEQKR